MGLLLLALLLLLGAWRACAQRAQAAPKKSAWESVGGSSSGTTNPAAAGADFEMPSASLSRLQQLRAVKAQHGAAGLVKMFPGTAEDKAVV